MQKQGGHVVGSIPNVHFTIISTTGYLILFGTRNLKQIAKQFQFQVPLFLRKGNISRSCAYPLEQATFFKEVYINKSS